MFSRCDHADVRRRELGALVLLAIVVVVQCFALKVSDGVLLRLAVALSAILVIGFIWRYRSKYSLRSAFLLWLTLFAGAGYTCASLQLPSPDTLREFDAYTTRDGESIEFCSPYRLARGRCGTTLEAVGRIQRNSRLNYQGEHWVRVVANVSGGTAAVMELRFPFLPWEDRLFVAGEEVAFEASVVATVLPETAAERSVAEQRLEVLYRQGVAATGFVHSYSLTKGRSRYTARPDFLGTLFLEHERRDALALIVASTLGEAQLLSRHVREIFRRTGTSHLIVVSGFHVGLAFFIGGALARLWFSMTGLRVGPHSRTRIEIVCGLFFVCFFWMSIPFSMPVLRALLFVVLFAYCQWYGGQFSGVESVCLVFVLANYISPGAFLDPSFQLTCAAVLGLERAERFICCNHQYADVPKMKKFVAVHGLAAREYGLLWRPIQRTFVRCLVVFIFTSPVVVFWFGTFQPTSVVWNFLLSGVFTAVVVIGGILGLIGALTVPTFGKVFLDAVLFAVEWVIRLVELFSDSPLNWAVELDPQERLWAVMWVATLAVAAAVFALAGTRPVYAVRSFHASEDAIPS